MVSIQENYILYVSSGVLLHAFVSCDFQNQFLGDMFNQLICRQRKFLPFGFQHFVPGWWYV